MFGACNVHEVIETQAVDDLQAKLDEAVALLKKSLEYGTENKIFRKEIRGFLRKVGG